MPTSRNPTTGPSVLERVYLWPLLATRRLVAAVGRHWKRIATGAAAGWVAAVVLGAVALALLENGGLLSRRASDTAGIAIVLGGVALGALCAYVLRPADPPEDAVPPSQYTPASRSSRPVSTR